MKSEVSPVLATIVVVIAVVIVGFIGYRMFAGSKPQAQSPEDAKTRAMQQYQRGMANRPGAGSGSGGMNHAPGMGSPGAMPPGSGQRP